MMTKKLKLIIVLLLTSVLFVGCAQESAPGSNNPTDPTTTDPTTGGTNNQPSTNSSAEVALNIVGSSSYEKVSNFSKYTGRAMMDPQNIRVNFNIKNRGDGNYGGTIKVKYTDRGTTYTGTFVNGDNSYYLSYRDEKESAKYNKWYQVNGKWVFHGFFQDDTGAIIVVLDGNSGLILGDGQIPSTYKGSIYYKNFNKDILYGYNVGPHAPTHCWFISEGPYDCRSWKSGDGVNTYKSLYPDNGYIKLGEFENLDIDKAFN